MGISWHPPLLKLGANQLDKREIDGKKVVWLIDHSGARFDLCAVHTPTKMFGLLVC